MKPPSVHSYAQPMISPSMEVKREMALEALPNLSTPLKRAIQNAGVEIDDVARQFIYLSYGNPLQGDRPVVIGSSEELVGLLHKAHELEAGFESVAEWEGYVSVRDEDMRAVLFELISDSSKHRSAVESMIGMIQIGLDAEARPLQPRVFNLRGKGDLEVMTEISRTEKLMFNVYSDIRSALGKSDSKALFKDEIDAQHVAATLDTLIDDETRHMKTVARYVHSVERLR
jgi:rubrerythrin